MERVTSASRGARMYFCSFASFSEAYALMASDESMWRNVNAILMGPPSESAPSRAQLEILLPFRGAQYAKHFSIFRHGTPGDNNVLTCEHLHDFLVAVGLAGVFFRDDL